jgi:bacteriocin-like protein
MNSISDYTTLSDFELSQITGGKKKKSYWSGFGSYYKGYIEGLIFGR